MGSAGSFRDLFLIHYETIRETCMNHNGSGLACVAVDENGVAGSAWIAAKPRFINAAIVGRHTGCDLYLDADRNLSLRHLAIILHPLGARWEDIRFRIVDLRTATAFMDERDRRMEALEAEGPVFIRCGAYSLFFFPTVERDEWPDDADEGWLCIPKRVYFDEAPAEPDRWMRRQLKALWGNRSEQGESGRHTAVRTIRGPSRANRRLIGNGDEVRGHVEVRSGRRASTIAIGKMEMREGVLFGRYERCDQEGLSILSGEHVSRVHLLLIEIAGVPYAIDTASSNGVRIGADEMRVARIEDGTTLSFGRGLAQLCWRNID